MPGLVRRSDGLIRLAPNLEWHDVSFGGIVLAALGLDIPVSLANDADLGALAEHVRGVGGGGRRPHLRLGQRRRRRRRHLGRRRLEGAGGYAGEIGHLRFNPAGRQCHCGNRGCWETEVGATRSRRPSTARRTRSGAASTRCSRLCTQSAELPHRHGARPGPGQHRQRVQPQMVVLGGYFRSLYTLVGAEVEPGWPTAPGRSAGVRDALPARPRVGLVARWARPRSPSSRSSSTRSRPSVRRWSASAPGWLDDRPRRGCATRAEPITSSGCSAPFSSRRVLVAAPLLSACVGGRADRRAPRRRRSTTPPTPSTSSGSPTGSRRPVTSAGSRCTTPRATPRPRRARPGRRRPTRPTWWSWCLSTSTTSARMTGRRPPGGLAGHAGPGSDRFVGLESGAEPRRRGRTSRPPRRRPRRGGVDDLRAHGTDERPGGRLAGGLPRRHPVEDGEEVDGVESWLLQRQRGHRRHPTSVLVGEGVVTLDDLCSGNTRKRCARLGLR